MGRDLNAPRQATSVDSSEGRRQIRRIVPEKAPSTLRHDDERRGLPGLWQGGAEGGTGTPRPLAARSSFLCRAEEPISPSLEVGLRRDGGDAETEADIRNIYPGNADRPVATFLRRRDYADRSVVLAHARADASIALTDALDAAQAAVADLEARNSVTRTALAQTQVAAALTRARLLVALSNLRSHETAAQAADAYNAEVARRQIEARRLADRAALEAQWAEEQATIAAAADQRIQSMYGGFQIPDGLGGN